VVPSQLQEPDRHIERTRAERRPGEAVALCGGCDQIGVLAQPAKPVHRCEATAVRHVATDGAERLKTGEETFELFTDQNRINVRTAPVVLGARGSRGVHIGSGAVPRGNGPEWPAVLLGTAGAKRRVPIHAR
jgi:hypothetical protein